MSNRMIEPSDPLFDVEDMFPLSLATPSSAVAEPAALQASPVPLGFRFAAHPAHEGKHGKTYATVIVTEDTERCDDGKVYTIPDAVEREVEID